MKLSKTWVAAAAIVALCGTAQAALVDQGNATVLDTNTNLIWLQDWFLNGFQNWSTQKAWAEGLSFAGSSDWQLPTASEFNALSTAYGTLSNVGAFTRVYFATWSGTAYEYESNSAFVWLNYGLVLTPAPLSAYFPATAVRAVPAPVPEPQTYAMMALGLAAIGGFVARRRKQDPAA